MSKKIRVKKGRLEELERMSEVRQDAAPDAEIVYDAAALDDTEAVDDLGASIESTHTYVDKGTTTDRGAVKQVLTALKYCAAISAALIYWELIMAARMGSLSASTLFFLFFIPAEAAFFTFLSGWGNKISSRITFPIVLLIPTIYYIVQTVYLTNFGSLFSISMTGMGTDAMGDFGWALTDSIIEAIPAIILLILPIIISVAVIVTKAVLVGRHSKSHDLSEDAFVDDDSVADEKTVQSRRDFASYLPDVQPYKAWTHGTVIAAAVVLWFAGILCIRMFGTQRPAPYYLFTSSQVTSDLTAKKLGVVTTGIVETGSYYFGIGGGTESEFTIEEEDEIFTPEPVADSGSIKVIPQGMTEEEMDAVPEIERVPWINEDLDFEKVMAAAPDDESKALAEFFAKRKPSETNEYTGMFEGYNLIYICAESFWNYACNEKVTPTLYKMANNGIVLDNYYNAFFNTTTNGEYAFATSLWPDVSRNSKNGTDVGSFAQSASKFMPQGLGDLFTAQNIPSYAYHNYYGKYYRRILSWPNLGYKCRFTGDGMWFTSNWPASDLELMQQSVDDYINDEQFHAYYMTFSGHGPYSNSNYMFNKNIGAVTEILGDSKYNLDARGYFAGEMELDKAMEYLLGRLEEAGKLDNTLIVIAGDHYPYYLSDEGRTSVAQYDIDQTFDIYKSSCIMYNAGMEEPLVVKDYCSNVDIVPTVLNLFNIPFDSRLMMGRDIFSEQAHKRGTLYNMSFISDMVRYNYETGEAKWTPEGDKLSAEDKDRYIKSQLANIENEYNVACKIIEKNFFLTAYEACGILSGDEIAEEKSREASVKSRDETLNAEDEEAAMMRELEKQQEEAAAAAQLLLEQGGVPADGAVPAVPADGTIPAGNAAVPDGGAAPVPPADGTVQ